MPPDVSSSRSAKSHGIFHLGKDKNVGVQDLASLPAHVNIVKDGLLDFNGFLGLEAAMLVLGDGQSDEDDGDGIPLCAYKTDGLKASQRAREREFLESAQGLARGAQRLESGLAQDGEWRTLFRHVVTSRKDDVCCFDSHQPSMIACAENERWDSDLDPSQSPHTSPKPDLYFGFPIHDTEHHKLTGFGNDPSLQNFTVNTLFQLTTRGIRCVPASSSLAGIVETETDSTELQVPLPCFPWCIIQLKGVEEATEINESNDSALETACKVSTAATGALAMFETLSRFADTKQDGQHIPPVVTITSVGSNTTVWLAYSDIIDDQYRDHMMVSIWTGCISKIWDAIQFCRILDNLLFWSQHILRPQVSHYIDQWRLSYSPEVYNLHYQLERNIETAELIHQIQDRLSSLGISSNSQLPELIHQSVILQQLMKLNLRKTEPAPKEGPHPYVQDEIEIPKEIPSHPKVNASAVGASGDGLTEKGKQKGVESTEKEDKKKGGALGGDSRDNDIHYSAGSQDEPTLQLKLRDKNVAVLAAPPVNFEKCASKDSIATENKLGRQSIKTKSSTATDFTYSAAPSTLPPTSQLVSKSQPPNDSSAGEKRERESYPYKLNTSDFEFDQGPFPLHSLKSKSAGSEEPTASKDLASNKNSYGRSRNANTSSTAPNPFTARTFELSFDVKYWWCETPIDAQLPQARLELGPQSALHMEPTSNSGKDEAGGAVRSEPPKRKKSAWQLAEIPKPPLSRVKVPWKDGRFIIVKLPPVMPASL